MLEEVVVQVGCVCVGWVVTVCLQVERLVTKHRETITAPSCEEAVNVLELLVTRLGILE